MAEWKNIVIDKDIDTGSPIGVTQAMRVPGGMLVRTVQQIGVSMVFVPHQSGQHYKAVDITDTWLEDNKVV